MIEFSCGACQEELDKLRDRVRELEEDKERMDWLENARNELEWPGVFLEFDEDEFVGVTFVAYKIEPAWPTFREAIDAAREAVGEE